MAIVQIVVSIALAWDILSNGNCLHVCFPWI